MLSRFVRDDADQTRKHFFFGALLILLSLAVGSSLLGYTWESHAVLGTQTLAQSMPGGTGDGSSSQLGTPGSGTGSQQGGSQQGGEQGGSSGTINQPEPTAIQVIQQPTSAPQPTDAPVIQQPIPTPTPIVVGSVPEIIDGAGPQADIVIRNEDNVLVVSTTTDPTHVAHVEPGESLSGSAPSVPSATANPSSGVIETILTYNPTTRKYDEVPATDTLSDDTSSVNTSAVDTLTSTFVKVFSQETYFPSASPATQNSINTNTSKNSIVYDWLTQYKFRIFPIGTSHLALYRNGITTITRFPIVLGLSRQSLRVLVKDVYKQVLYYPDSIWQDAVSKNYVSGDSPDEPITLTDQDGELVYRIEGQSDQLFMAFLPVSVCRKLEISAESQELRNISTCSSKDALLEALSITL